MGALRAAGKGPGHPQGRNAVEDAQHCAGTTAGQNARMEGDRPVRSFPGVMACCNWER